MRGRWLYVFLVPPVVILIGTFGYSVIEGWGLLDSLYMTVITVWTVGFTEVRALSDTGRVFTILLILVGVGSLAFAGGRAVEFMVEGQLRGILEERRMKRDISRMKGHHVIAGLGRVGSVVARTLADKGVEFVVIDRDEEALERARQDGWLVIEGDATEEEVLHEAGITQARSLVCAMDTDADNTFVTLTAKTVNPDISVAARTSAESSEGKLRRAGADHVITPSVIGGRRLATMVLNPVVSDYLDLVTHGGGLEFRLEELEVHEGCPLAGLTVGESRIRHKTGAYVLALAHGGSITSSVSPDTRLDSGDRLIALGTPEQLESLAALL